MVSFDKPNLGHPAEQLNLPALATLTLTVQDEDRETINFGIYGLFANDAHAFNALGPRAVQSTANVINRCGRKFQLNLSDQHVVVLEMRSAFGLGLIQATNTFLSLNEEATEFTVARSSINKICKDHVYYDQHTNLVLYCLCDVWHVHFSNGITTNPDTDSLRAQLAALRTYLSNPIHQSPALRAYLDSLTITYNQQQSLNAVCPLKAELFEAFEDFFNDTIQLIGLLTFFSVNNKTNPAENIDITSLCLDLQRIKHLISSSHIVFLPLFRSLIQQLRTKFPSLPEDLQKTTTNHKTLPSFNPLIPTSL